MWRLSVAERAADSLAAVGIQRDTKSRLRVNPRQLRSEVHDQ